MLENTFITFRGVLDMDEVALAYEKLIESFVVWAEKETAISSAVVIGSRARTDHPADQWADLDVIVVTHDPGRLLMQTDWLETIGKPVLTFIEGTSNGDEKERRVLFDNGLDADFSIIPFDKIEMMLKPEFFGQVAGELGNVFGRGIRVLLDKEGQVDRLGELVNRYQPPPHKPPREENFLQVVQDFWYHTVWTARHLRRGELWWGGSGLNGRLRELLFVMLEWQAHAVQGSDHDTWFRGRFLEEWADPRAVHELRGVFSHYDEEDTWQSLLAMMNLFRWLAVETAERWGFAYPWVGDAFATRLTNELLGDST
jgi:aminoglycoside 6-adenylyltransferase